MSWIGCAWAWTTVNATVLATVVSALAAVAIAGFTLSLKRSTDKLWAVSDKQAKIAQKALTDLERPYVFIYGVSQIYGDKSGAHIGYTVSNHGRMAAVVENVALGFAIVQGVTPEPPLDAERDHDLLQNPILSPAEKRERRLTYDLPANTSLDILDSDSPVRIPELKSDEEAFFQVIVTYRGPFTSGHETSQCWRYDELTKSLIEFSDPQYTYIR